MKQRLFSIFDHADPVVLERFFQYVLEEDLAAVGDVTTDAIFTDQKSTTGVLVAKAQGVVAGTELFEYILRKFDSGAEVKIFSPDGTLVSKGDQILKVTSEIGALLKAERLCLNFIGRLSGIATITQQFVSQVSHTGCKILDTRKTTPGLRFAEKYAVKVGGGVNHRMGLYDQVMIKDNHIDGAGGISTCVKKVRNCWGDRYPMIVETRGLDEVAEALQLQVDRILLDNMSIAQIQEAVQLVGGQIPLEASGNITLANAVDYAEAGVDFISTSFITAYAQPLDLSLVVDDE